MEKVEDPGEIARLHILATPALVVDGRVRSAGRVLTAEDIKELLRG